MKKVYLILLIFKTMATCAMLKYQEDAIYKHIKIFMNDHKCIYPEFFEGRSDAASAYAIYTNLEKEKSEKEMKEYYYNVNTLEKAVINYLKSLKEEKEKEKKEEENMPMWKKAAIAGAAVGGIATAVAAGPVLLPAMGFGQAGIAAGSWAASMMSSAAVANGGGVAAGGLVATLQSAGAAGLGAAGTAAAGAAGAAAGGAAGAAAGAAYDKAKSDKSNKRSNNGKDENQ